MMGTKQRNFVPLLHVSLEELVPHDHFYRHLERTLDLSLVAAGSLVLLWRLCLFPRLVAHLLS